MKRGMPEFAAIPITIVGIGLLFVILFAFHAGLAAWIVLGVILLVAILAFALYAMRRPRGLLPAQGEGVFEEAAPSVRDGVHRVLMIVDDVADARRLGAFIDGQGGGSSVLVVAPAVSSRVARWTGDEHAYRSAEEHLQATVEALGRLGYDADGRVGAHDPLQATGEALREFPADEIVFVLQRGRTTNWLEDGIVDLAYKRFGVPVREIDGAPSTAGGR
jgi:hypothetical protein